MPKENSHARSWLILGGIVAILVSLSFFKAGLVVLKSRMMVPLAIVGLLLIALARFRVTKKDGRK